MSATADPRLQRLQTLLGERGVADARVDAAGPQGEVAVLRVARAGWENLLADSGLPAAVRALGFRYVSLDLDGDPLPE